MPKINAKSKVKIINNNVLIFKYDNNPFYYVRYYKIKNFKKTKYEKSLNTQSINVARDFAKKDYENYLKERPNALTKSHISFNELIAQPYLMSRKRQYRFRKCKNIKQDVREKQDWENCLIKYFEDTDPNDSVAVEETYDQIVDDLKQENLSGITINKKIGLMDRMLRFAKDKGKIDVVPTKVTQQIIRKKREIYEVEEQNLINREFDYRYKKTKDIFYVEQKDYLNVIRSCGIRPGTEVLSLKRNNCEVINENNITALLFKVDYTKTKNSFDTFANPFFYKNIWPEIINRHNHLNLNEDDYLLFPTHKDRQKLKNKTGKLFTEVVKDMGIYYKNGQGRSLYVYRHTFATELYKKGVPLEEIAKMMNHKDTRMILQTYLSSTNTSLISAYKRVYLKNNNLKVVK